jgi:uncharacterized phage-associated protein
MNRFDMKKAKAAVLYIVSELEKVDFLHIFKILYFADKKHIAKWGRPVLNDTYIAMRNGPVPSMIYNLLKGDVHMDDFSDAFTVVGYTVSAKKKPCMDFLSQADIEAIDESIRENAGLSFGELSEKSHDKAWQNADTNNRIDYMEIVRASGASKEMIEYAAEESELDNLLA